MLTITLCYENDRFTPEPKIRWWTATTMVAAIRWGD